MFKVLLLITTLSISAKAACHNHFYSKDFTYFEEYDAFYKVHWDASGTSSNAAFMVCDEEGSQLFYPKEEGEWTVVKNLTSKLAEAPNTTDVIVGIHDETGDGDFVTIDGQPSPEPFYNVKNKGRNCVIMDLESGMLRADFCIASHPLSWRLYVCKKIDEKPCSTIDLGYKYEKESKKCYKVNTRARTWKEAWHTCFMEGGMLVTPGNKVENKLLRQILPSYGSYFAGFRRKFPGSGFYTVKDKILEESGFPDFQDPSQGTKQDCGIIRKDNIRLYSDSGKCNINLPFVCEMLART